MPAKEARLRYHCCRCVIYIYIYISYMSVHIYIYYIVVYIYILHPVPAGTQHAGGRKERSGRRRGEAREAHRGDRKRSDMCICADIEICISIICMYTTAIQVTSFEWPSSVWRTQPVSVLKTFTEFRTALQRISPCSALQQAIVLRLLLCCC